MFVISQKTKSLIIIILQRDWVMASSTSYIATYNRDNCKVTVRDAGTHEFTRVIMPPIELSPGDGPCLEEPIICFGRDNSQLACYICHLVYKSRPTFKIYLHIIDVSSGMLVKSIRSDFCYYLSFTADRNRLIFQDNRGRISLIDTSSDTSSEESILNTWTTTTISESWKVLIQLSCDGSMMASCDGAALLLWDTNTCKEIARLVGTGHESNISCVSASRVSHTTVTVDSTGVVAFWDMGVQSQVGLVKLGGAAAPTSFREEGSLFVCYSLDAGCVYVLSTETYQVMTTARVDVPIKDVCFLPSSTHLVCRTDGKVWTNKLLDLTAILNEGNVRLGEWTLDDAECFICSSLPAQLVLL
jgi:hypothetical protein